MGEIISLLNNHYDIDMNAFGPQEIYYNRLIKLIRRLRLQSE